MKEFRLGLLVLVSWLILMLAIGGGLILFGHVIATEEVKREIHQSLAQVSKIGILLVNNRLDALTLAAEQIARNPQLSSLMADGQYIQAEDILYNSALANEDLEFGVLALITPDGKVRANGGSMSLSEDALLTIRNDLVLSRDWQYFKGDWDVAIRAETITDPVLGKTVGVLVYGLSLQHNLSLMREIVQETGTLAAALSIDDTVVSRYPLKPARKDDPLELVLAGNNILPEGIYSHWMEIPVGNVYLVLVQGSDRIYDLTRAFQVHFAWLVSITLVAGALVFLVVRFTFLRHATLLTNYAKSLSDAPRYVDFPRGMVTEFNEMGEALSGTFHQLKDAETALRTEVQARQDDLRRLSQEHTLSDSRLRLILDSAVDSILTIDNKGYITSVNPAAELLFGWSKEEAEGLNFAVLLSSVDNATVYSGTEGIEILGDLIFRWNQQEDTKAIEVSACAKDGTNFTVEMSVSELINDDLHIYTVIVRDISARKAMETRLQDTMETLQFSQEKNKESARQLKDILDSSSSAIVICSEKIDMPLYSNARYFDLFGIRSPGDLHAVGGQRIFQDKTQLDRLNNAIFNRLALDTEIMQLSRLDGTAWRALVDVKPVQYQDQQATIVWIHPLD